MGRAWFDRRFSFAHLTGDDFPYVVERLRGAPARAADKLEGLAPRLLTRRDGESWSLQEHLGHLVDLDALHDARLDDYLAGAPVLRAADLQNRKTHEAGHNERPLRELLAEFRREREHFVERLDGWDPGKVLASAVHPRLDQPMRVVDMAYFAAEHDDHHLRRMTELLERWRR
jgi:hypothetical protein